MRTIILGIVLSAIAGPAFSQRILKHEPLALDAYTVILVDHGSCSVGKVLKVTGSLKGLRRKKACVTVEMVEASSARL